MTSFHGDEDEMGTTDHGLSIDEVDRLLDGHLPAGRDDLAGWAADLASLSAAYDRDVDAVDVRRWATQAAALAGLTPTDNGDLAATSGSNAYRPASQVAGLPKRRIPVLKSIAAFLATTFGKTMVAGALVAATATGGLAATGNLPGQSEAPRPASVEDDTSGPGVLHAGGLDENDSSDDSCSTPTTAAPAGAVAASAGSTGCTDDAVDDGTDDACDDQAVAGASAAGADEPDDDADELDDDSADEPDDDADDACEVADDQADVSSDDDAVEADGHDADEVESDDGSTDTADDATDDDVEVDDESDGSDAGSSGTDDEHQDSSDGEGAGTTPQG
jgi:hypothetical protein